MTSRFASHFLSSLKGARTDAATSRTRARMNSLCSGVAPATERQMGFLQRATFSPSQRVMFHTNATIA
jgi:hypothetical protein